MPEMFSSLSEFLSSPFLAIGDAQISILGLFKFAVVFWLGFFLGRHFKNKISDLRTDAISRENKAIISKLGYYAILITTIVVGLTALGINLSSLAMIASAVSVGIGFGLQNIVANFISGIILMFEKTIRVGDLIELPTKDRGWVKEINMRSTIIATSDNTEIIVPNQIFITQNIVNLSYSDSIRRIMMNFGAAYGSDIEDVKKTVINKIKNSDLIYIKEKPLEVRLTSLGDSALNFVLVAYIDARLGVKTSYEFDFLPLIYNALNEAKISIPFPQIDIHLNQPSNNAS